MWILCRHGRSTRVTSGVRKIAASQWVDARCWAASTPRRPIHALHKQRVDLHRHAQHQHHLQLHHVLPSSSLLSSSAALRGAKTKSKARLTPLPQGTIPLDPLPADAEVLPAYPTVMQQARTNMDKFQNCVLLTRVGGFYELYFEHAEEYGPLMNLKVVGKKTAAGPVMMAGFPFFQLDRFLKILVQDLNQYVAISEEFLNDAAAKVRSGGLAFDRRVARIITPGTLIDENFMDPYSNNYVLAVHVEGEVTDNPSTGSTSEVVAEMAELPLGLAWLDLSTGNFFTESTTVSSLSSIISRIAPREVVLDESIKRQGEDGIASLLSDGRHLLTYTPPGDVVPMEQWKDMLEAEIPSDTAESFTSQEVAAGSMLLEYVKTRLQTSSMKLQPPQRYKAMDVMGIDKNSMKALEIKETIRDGNFKGSLLHTVRRTVTKGGTRLLTNWLSAPSTSMDVINARLNLVEHMLGDEVLRERIITYLKRSHDSQRLVQKFTLGRGDADDMIGLALSIDASKDIVAVLKESRAETYQGEWLNAMISRINLSGPDKLSRRIKDAIDEEGVVLQHRIEDSEAQTMMELAEEVVSAEGSTPDAAGLPKTRRKKLSSVREYYDDDAEVWTMKPTASSTLEKLHAELKDLTLARITLNTKLSTELKIPSLTLKWTPNLGHICHVKGKDTNKVSSFRSVNSSKTTRSFHHPDWTSLGHRIVQIKARIRAEEQLVFQELREQVIKNLVRLRRNAAVLDELDIGCSFAVLAEEQKFVRPILNDGTTHKIMCGRHPTVESGLHEHGRSFVVNDCVLGGAERVWLITGPNMAGKSTFLRQNAVITMLAQVGSFVPVAYAELGIVDHIFSRVGSADNLFADQSTFMVEMLETAAILRHATPRSFVIMDEIGRGTTPEDGTAVAFAALHHLCTVNQCRGLFATHFHALPELAGQRLPAVGYYCTDVVEDGIGGFSFDRRLRKGVNYRSHALKVAKLAGLPDAAIEVARGVLKDVYHRETESSIEEARKVERGIS